MLVLKGRKSPHVMKILYKAEATVQGGRNGHAATSDGALSVELASPAELGGKGKEGTNPEQLFAAGYAACFGSALELVTKRKKLQYPSDAKIIARVGLGARAEGAFEIEVELEAHLPGMDQAEAEALVHDAHNVCPYSHATRNNIGVTTKTYV
jgi:osmotically inducible protein OsmC